MGGRGRGGGWGVGNTIFMLLYSVIHICRQETVNSASDVVLFKEQGKNCLNKATGIIADRTQMSLYIGKMGLVYKTQVSI